jgi:hypothetical protein
MSAACSITILRAPTTYRCTKQHVWSRELGRWITLDYAAGRWFKFTTHPVANIRDLGALIDAKRAEPELMIVRGAPSKAALELMAQPNMLICRKLSGPSVEGTLDDIPIPWLLTDIDKFPAGRLELIGDPEAVVRRAIKTMLPPEFRDVTCFYQFSASAGFKDGIAGIHIWWWLDRSVDSPTIKRWLEDKIKPTQRGKCKVDCSIISGNIPHFFADPVINGGHDPLPRRTGFIEGEAEFVTPPTDLRIVAPRAAISLQWSGPAELQREYNKLKSALEFIPAFAEVEREARIKIGLSIKAQLGEAGRGLWLTWASSGANAEKNWNGFHPTRVTGATIYKIGRDAGWSPPAGLAAPAGPEVVPPPIPLPTGTVKEAAAALATAVKPWWGRAAATADKRINMIIAETAGTTALPPPDGEQGLVMAGLGIGKTEVTLSEVGKYLSEPTPDRPRPRRCVFISPDHALAEDIASRFRTMFRNVPCQVYLGAERPDPAAPGFDDPTIPVEKKTPMCRRLADALEIIVAGGSISTLCGSERRGFCPHHPDYPGATPETICGRQKATVIKSGLLILAGPEALSQAPPNSFRRHVNVETTSGEKRRAHLPPADVLVADEPRLLSNLGGVGEKPYDVTTVELNAPLRRFTGDPARADDVNAACCQHAFANFTRILTGLPIGPITVQTIRRLVAAHDWSVVPKSVLSFKADPDAFIKPAMTGKRLHDIVKKLKAHNGRLFRLARLAHVLLDAAAVLKGHPDDAESGLIERLDVTLGGVEMPAARLRWIKPVAKQWRGIPTLLLDGTANVETANLWFPALQVIAQATAATPDCVTRTQVYDSAFPYLNWVPKEKEPPAADDMSRAARRQRTCWNNIGRLARLLVVRCAQYRGQGRDGIDVLAAMPLRTEQALEHWFNQHGGMPAGLAIRHFNKLRGQDGFGGVRCLIMISRPQPPTHELERIAWTLSGVRGTPVPNGKLPEVPAAYLMADGSGRQASAVRHPDPWAERVRVALCDTELVQAEGRARALRRTPDRPLAMEILTDIPLPLPIDQLITADDALADSHPARWLVAVGVVPVLGARGVKQFVAAVLGVNEEAAKKELEHPEWKETLTGEFCHKRPSLMAKFPSERWSVRLAEGDRYSVAVLINATTEADAHSRLTAVGVTAAEVRKGPARPAAEDQPAVVEAEAVASIGKIGATGTVVPWQPEVIEVRAVSSIGRIGAVSVMEHTDPVEALAQQLLAAAEDNPAITFASRAQALAYYRSAAVSELARKARAKEEDLQWEAQVEILRYRAEQERPFDEWWEGLGAAA